MANGDSLDINSMYSILKDIFNREQNENYTNRNRSAFAGGLADLRNGWAAMQNARKNRRDQAEYKNSMGNGNNNPYAGGSIGATGEGVYGVNSMPPQPTGGGIGVDANGMYGVSGATPQPNKFNFDGGNGFDWSKMGQMPNGGSVMDAWGKQGSMFNGMGNGEEKPDNTMNITSQTIGNNYNNRIDGQVGGLGIPQTPQGDGGFNSVFNGKDLNPFQPSISSSNLAQGIGGQNVSANDLSRYLGNEYNRARWIQDDMANNGVTNPLISMLRYDTKVAPLIKAAKEEELRNAFFTLNNPNASEQDRMNAMALIEYRKGNPFLEEDHQYKMGNVENPDYGGGSSAGNAVLKALGDYTEGDQWMSPDGTGDSRTQCSNFVSDVLRKIGLNIGSPNGDELMRQFGKAYHTGLDGIQAGDVLNFKDHVGIYVGNGQYVARNSSGGVHQGSMEEAIQAFGQPLGYGSVGELTGTSRRQRFIKDPNRVSQREIFNANNAYRNSVINTKQNAINAKYGNQNSVPNKNSVGLRKSAMALAGLQNVSSEDTKGQENYNKAVDSYAENIAKSYDLKGSSLDSNNLGIALYKKLNEDKSGLRPETLARAAATAVYLARGDVNAGDLQKVILANAYNEGNGEKPEDGKKTTQTGKKEVDLTGTAQSENPKDLEKREQEGALNELDEVRDYSDFGQAIMGANPYVKSVIDLKNPTKQGLKKDLNNLITIDPTIREQLEGGY